MSADLEFRPSIIKISAPDRITDDDDGDQGCVAEEDCHTPRSPQHMIPPILSCPPAPRKPPPRRTGASCKRRLWEFEIVAGEEIESFFKRVEEGINRGGGGAAKRRCVM
ncbi:hypothetical protein Salat_0751600 [Sesamum alatum]|uniref:Uncharacterized protein n=1 Tax=Sesamum alatum TaxID=300844 RepID=A0AAE1YSY0_9LAMI|nr:hypothetical protein Salat_0751600 [Sesamum alatum]